MKKAIAHLQQEFAAVRTGRASPGLVEKLRVEVYGSEVPLQQIAGFGVPEPRVLTISPYDKTTLKAIEKAIQQSDLGVNPSNDGSIIRLVFPELTEETRKNMVKLAHKRAEEGRVAVRNARRHARHELEQLQKDGEISEDDLDRAEKDLEKRTHEIVAEVDELLKHKEAELLAI
jgi:ribosome recycling factor